MFFLITPLLGGIAVNEQVSYHQFVTNPSEETLKKANNTLEVRTYHYTVPIHRCTNKILVGEEGGRGERV